MEIGTRNSGCLVVAVDLLPLRPGGENGGIKPAIFTLISTVGTEAGADLVFVFITNSAAHSQVRGLLREADLLVCALEDSTIRRGDLSLMDEREFVVMPPPADFVRRIGADILYCPFGAATLHCPGIPTVALIADLLHRDYPFTLTSTQIAERESYLQQTIEVASKIQCISRSGLESVMRHYNVPYRRLFFTYLPIHLRLAKAGAESETQSNLFAGRPYFFYPANLWIHKNHETLLVGYLQYRNRLKEDACDLVLTFQADSRADELESIAETFGISEFVHFAGFVEQDVLERIWQNARALVFPSLHEGFGVPLLEAMHYGVPIVCGDEYALREVAGDACYLVDARNPTSLADGLREVGHNEEMRARLVKRGRERLQLFDLNATARTLLREFRAAVRAEEGFPRVPNYMREAPIFVVPTPASSARWKIELILGDSESPEEFELYLDDLPFGTVLASRLAAKSVFFFCRPGGRSLSLRRVESGGANGSLDQCKNPVARIVARDEYDSCVLLYEQ